ncbi:hypothetical protein ACFL9T_14515 [Thermodesulfobacteriota bacterium]
MCKIKKWLFLVLSFLFFCTSAYGKEDLPDSDAWNFALTPYFWLPAQDADSTVSGQTSSIDMSFGDTLDTADEMFGLSARFVAWKGKWGFIFDGMYVDMDMVEDVRLQTPDPVDIGIEVDTTQKIFDFAVAYRTDEWPIGAGQGSSAGGKGPAMWFEPYAGLRYSYLRNEIHLGVNVPGVGGAGTVLGGSEDWIEPFVGGSMVFRLNDRWKFAVRGDAGGFGIGDASDFTWNLLFGFDYKPWQKTSIKFGYKIYGLDYETGSGADRFGFDGQMYGPLFGVTFHF